MIQPVMAEDENLLGALKPFQCSGLTFRVIRLNWYEMDPIPTKLFLKLPTLCLWIWSVLVVISNGRRGRELLPLKRICVLFKAEQGFECRLQSQCRGFWVQGTFLFFDSAIYTIAGKCQHGWGTRSVWKILGLEMATYAVGSGKGFWISVLEVRWWRVARTTCWLCWSWIFQLCY